MSKTSDHKRKRKTNLMKIQVELLQACFYIEVNSQCMCTMLRTTCRLLSMMSLQEVPLSCILSICKDCIGDDINRYSFHALTCITGLLTVLVQFYITVTFQILYSSIKYSVKGRSIVPHGTLWWRDASSSPWELERFRVLPSDGQILPRHCNMKTKIVNRAKCSRCNRTTSIA